MSYCVGVTRYPQRHIYSCLGTGFVLQFIEIIMIRPWDKIIRVLLLALLPYRNICPLGHVTWLTPPAMRRICVFFPIAICILTLFLLPTIFWIMQFNLQALNYKCLDSLSWKKELYFNYLCVSSSYVVLNLPPWAKQTLSLGNISKIPPKIMEQIAMVVSEGMPGSKKDFYRHYLYSSLIKRVFSNFHLMLSQLVGYDLFYK